jgi:hypothetical protein
MNKLTASLLIFFASLSAQAYEVTYECSPAMLGFLDYEPVYISIDADASDRKNKVFYIAVDDSQWVEVKTNNQERYTSISTEIPSWGEGKFQIQMHNKVLSGAYKGKVFYKEESSIISRKLNCVSTSREHQNIQINE